MSLLKYFLCLWISLIHTEAEIQRFTCNDELLGSVVYNYLVKLRIDANVIDYYDYDYSYRRTDFCSGAIIDKKWIISAAHCFADNVTKVTIMSAKERIIGFSKKIVIHPDFIQDPKFNYYNGQNDLALVRTEKPIRLNAFTQPIGLAKFGSFGSTGIITGYESYSSSEFPLEDVAVVKQCECAPNDSLMICAQSLTHMESAASGAPLKTDDGLIGIVSAIASLPTGEQYFIVDISLHFDWIKKVTKKKTL